MITFLATSRKRGAVRAVGPVTGTTYVITPEGTPVSDFDLRTGDPDNPGLLEMVEDPCCGNSLPLGGKVKVFGVTSATKRQWNKVPDELLYAEPIVPEKPVAKSRRKKAAKVIPVVEEEAAEPSEEPVEEPVEESDVKEPEWAPFETEITED